jgi:hypothetical protein
MALRKIQSGMVSNVANIGFNTGTAFASLSVVGTLTTGILSATTVIGNILSSTNWNSTYTTYNQISSLYVTSIANSISAIALSARFIDLVHPPANDNVNPVLRIGEIDNTSPNVGFSGVFISYNEITNVFGISSLFAPTPGVAALSIDRDAKVGVGTDAPNEKLTVIGNVSASGNITCNGNVSASGNITCNGNISVSGSITTASFFISGGKDLSQVLRDNYSDVPTTYTTFHGVANKTLPYSSTRPFSANWDLNNYQSATLYLSASNALLRNPTNQVSGGTYTLFVRTLSGNATLFFDSLYRFPDSVAPTVSQGASAIDIFSFMSDGQYMYGTAVQNFTWA